MLTYNFAGNLLFLKKDDFVSARHYSRCKSTRVDTRDTMALEGLNLIYALFNYFILWKRRN